MPPPRRLLVRYRRLLNSNRMLDRKKRDENAKNVSCIRKCAASWNLKLKITTSTAVHCGKQTFIKDFPVLIDFWQFWLLFLLNRCLSNNQTGCDMQTLPSMIWVQIENFSIAIFNHLSTQNSNFLWKSFHLKSFFPPSEILLFLFIRSLPCASAAGWARIESKTVSCCCYRARAIKIN